MATEIALPTLSSTMSHGNLVRWHVAEGDTVEAGDVVADIETDKSVLELESPETGVIGRLLFSEGDEDIPVGTAIAILCANVEEVSGLVVDSAEQQASQSTSTPAEESGTPSYAVDSAQPETSGGERLRASPSAKRIAREAGIDLQSVKGSGPAGRVTKQDVELFVQNANTGAQEVAGSDFTEIPLRGIRKSIAQSLIQSKQTIPHFYLDIDVELDRLIATREDLNDSIAPDRVSINDFILRAVALSLRKFPAVNAQLIDNTVRQYENADVSVAVALDEGLVTPIVREADKLSLRRIARRTRELAAKAREGKLLPEEYQGGTFTLSNLGMHGIKSFSAIINPPQAAILAVGAARNCAVVRDGNLVAAAVMSVTLSCDHRVVDGKLGADFLGNVKRLLEKPLLLLEQAE